MRLTYAGIVVKMRSISHSSEEGGDNYEKSLQLFSRTGSTSGGSTEKAAAEMLDYRGSGMSVMEMSHRSKAFADHH